MEPRVNRVVTGFDAGGLPAVIFHGEPATVIRAGRYTTTELWVSPRAPIAATDADPATGEWALEPPPGGGGFRGAHATDTLDFVTILRGEVTLVVAGREVVVRPGDSVVQQPGVPHDWQNRSAEPAVMVGVLISARQDLAQVPPSE
jgi:mannose-6-phosphate isomerase-like protein (cupin superfamily)